MRSGLERRIGGVCTEGLVGKQCMILAMPSVELYHLKEVQKCWVTDAERYIHFAASKQNSGSAVIPLLIARLRNQVRKAGTH